MSAAEIRSEIDRYLDLVKDESFLKVVHSMLGTYVKEKVENPIADLTITGIPSTKEEIDVSIEKAEEQIARKEYYSIDEVKEKTAQWFNTK